MGIAQINEADTVTSAAGNMHVLVAGAAVAVVAAATVAAEAGLSGTTVVLVC